MTGDAVFSGWWACVATSRHTPNLDQGQENLPCLDQLNFGEQTLIKLQRSEGLRMDVCEFKAIRR